MLTVSYLIRYNSLLQNAIDIITKCDSYFIIKCDRIVLQDTSGFFYYKIRQFYYKMRHLLQIATILLQNATFITKCNFSYKLRQYSRLSFSSLLTDDISSDKVFISLLFIIEKVYLCLIYIFHK